MNIIKLNDIIYTESDPNADIFNTYLKGKYAYWIQFKYVVPLEHISKDDYIRYESDPDQLNIDKISYIGLSYDSKSKYIDYNETDSINNVIQYINSNKIVPDYPLTIDDLRVFRTWLAKTMLMFDTLDYKTLYKYMARLKSFKYIDRYKYLVEVEKQTSKRMKYRTNMIAVGGGDPVYHIYTPKETYMLQYYANNMYDDVIKRLSLYGPSVYDQDAHIQSCECCTKSGSIFSNINSCDCVDVYRKNIYNTMVETFSKPEIWILQDKKFIANFKLYIDEIIKSQLPLSPSIYNTPFSISKQSIMDCGCHIADSDQKYINILKNLSTTLGYIMDDDVLTHKNFISQSLYEWSSLLYEQMYWA